MVVRGLFIDTVTPSRTGRPSRSAAPCGSRRTRSPLGALELRVRTDSADLRENIRPRVDVEDGN